MGSTLLKILGTILEADIRRTQTNGPENKKTNDHACILEMTLTGYMCGEKRKEGDLPALNTAMTHWYNDL